jgi:hypothetical protein
VKGPRAHYKRRPIAADLGVLRRVTSSATPTIPPTRSPFPQARSAPWRPPLCHRAWSHRASQSGSICRSRQAQRRSLTTTPCRLFWRHRRVRSAPRDSSLARIDIFPHRFRVCLAYAGRVAGLAWFPHARPHCRVQPGLWSYGLPEQARERGESFAHRERGYHVPRAWSTQASVATSGLLSRKASASQQRHRPVIGCQLKAARCATCRARARQSGRGHARPRRDPSADRPRANPNG